MAAIVLTKMIPDQVINEGAAFKPLDFKQFIQASDARSELSFEAGLDSGAALPQGLICTRDGVFSGIPASKTEGSYVVVLKVEDLEGERFSASFQLVIKPVLTMQAPDLLKELKSKVWAAAGKDQPLPAMPELGQMLAWPLTAGELYYLFERFAYLSIWNAYNTEAPGVCKLLVLNGVSPHYQVFDRGSCLVGAPKDLFSYQRTSRDAIMTARAMADEVYKRGWTIEFSGFDKMVRAAWVKLQVLGKQHEKYLEILNYRAPAEDAIIYSKELEALGEQRPGL